MSTNNTILTIFAFSLLTSVMLSFYRLLALSGDDISGAQDMILATSLSTSYIEIAKGLAFDNVTDSSSVALYNPSVLTDPNALGPENAAEDTIYNFDDVDDFNGFVTDREASGTGRRFTTTFAVHYVDPLNIQNISTVRTFVKRLDLRSWRSAPPAPAGAKLDTLRSSITIGYFHFD
jgi:CRISPR/Cas system-associated protein Cas7 (RAMP superfamily)